MVHLSQQQHISPSPEPKLRDHPFSDVYECLFSIFSATLHFYRLRNFISRWHGPNENTRMLRPQRLAAQTAQRSNPNVWAGSLTYWLSSNCAYIFLCSVDRASSYNLVNKSNSVHNSVQHIYILFFSTCFGLPCDFTYRQHPTFKVIITFVI